jgi:hypothetical protein
MADVEAMLTRREQIADEIAAAAAQVGALCREEQELAERVRRGLRAIGLKAEPLSTAVDFRQGVCAELSAAGLDLRRTDPRVTLGAVVDGQHRNIRSLLKTKGRAA